MIFSSSKKFIFFAVPKTGTHAVREAIRPSLGKDDWEQQALTGVMLSPVPQLAKIGHGHISYQQLAEILTNEHIGSYFSFAVVRHPIDRFMSVCAFLARTDPSYNDNPVAWSQSAFQRAAFHNGHRKGRHLDRKLTGFDRVIALKILLVAADTLNLPFQRRTSPALKVLPSRQHHEFAANTHQRQGQDSKVLSQLQRSKIDPHC